MRIYVILMQIWICKHQLIMIKCSQLQVDIQFVQRLLYGVAHNLARFATSLEEVRFWDTACNILVGCFVAIRTVIFLAFVLLVSKKVHRKRGYLATSLNLATIRV